MPAAVAPKDALAFGAGWLYASAPGQAFPAHTVASSVFSVVPNPAIWFLLGVTREGHELTIDLSVDPVEAAEYLEPIQNVTTGRTVTIATDMMQMHVGNWLRAFNGGTATPSGSGATLLTSYRLPQLGQETRIQLLWESTDSTERWTAASAFQQGSVSISRRKGADNASLPVEWTLEPDTNGDPFLPHFAGAIRGRLA